MIKYLFSMLVIYPVSLLYVCVTVIPSKMEHGVFRVVDYSREAHLESRTVSSNADTQF